MSLRLGALQDALTNAGATDDLARKAAEEVAEYERQMSDIRTELRVVKWMLGSLVGLSLGNLWASFTLLSRLPR